MNKKKMPPPAIIDLASSSDFLCRDVISRNQSQVGSTGNLIQKNYYHVSGNVANVSAAEVVSLDGNNDAQFHFLGRSAAAPLNLANITSNTTPTWSAISAILSLGRDTTTLRSGGLVVGNLIASTITGNLTSFIIGPGAETKLDNFIVRSFQKNLASTAGHASEICTVQNARGASTMELTVVQSETGSSVAKTYKFPVRALEMAGVWHRLLPLTSTSVLNFGVDIRVNNSTTTLRLVRLSGSVTSNIECVLTVYQSRADPVTITDSTQTATEALITTPILYESTRLTQVAGRVGIGTSDPTSTLTVAGTTSATSFIAVDNIVTGRIGTGPGTGLSNTTPLTQGGYMAWNYNQGDGKTDFVCKRGEGIGGFNFMRSHGNGSAFSDGKLTLATLSPSGMSSSLFSAPGAIVGSLFATGTDSTIAQGVAIISPAVLSRATNGTGWITVATLLYTPKSTSSRLFINFDVGYVMDGSGQDAISSSIFIDNTIYTFKTQSFGQSSTSSGTGTRSGTLFPISGVVNNASTAQVSITIRLYLDNFGDNIALSSTSYQFEVLERQS